MKVIIVEVTRAANSFGLTHRASIGEAYASIAAIVQEGQDTGELRPGIDPRLAASAFYGALEQVLTGWILAPLAPGEAELEAAERQIVEIVCGGLER